MVDPDLSPRPAPAVELSDGDDASGMAIMIADLLADNLRDYRGRARVAALLRGSVVLTAADRDLSITLTFGRAGVSVADGAAAGAAAMAGPWLAMSRVCSGRMSPLEAVARRELTVTSGRSLWALPAAGWVLSVPAAYYLDAAQRADLAHRRRMRLAAGLVVVASLSAMAVVLGRRRC